MAKQRQMTFDELKRTEKREALKTLQAAEGYWEYYERQVTQTYSNTNRVGLLFSVSAPDDSKVQLYAMDVLMGLTVTSNGSDKLIGAMVSFKMKPGQNVYDFFVGTNPTAVLMPKSSAEAADLARYGVYRMVTLVEPGSSSDGITQRSLTVPVRAMMRGNRIKLLPGEHWGVYLGLFLPALGTNTVKLASAGRFRVLKEKNEA